MKKKILVMGMTLVMSAAMLTACGGSSKDDYLADVKAITEFSNSATTAAATLDMDAYNSALDDLEMKTKEGKALKADMEEMGEILSDAVEMMEDPTDVDAANELQEKMTELTEKAEEDSKAFVEAAEKSGVDDEDVEDLNLGF